MKPIIVKNSIVPKLFSWLMKVGGVTIFPFIFVRGEGSDTLIRHESIHIKQYAELYVIGFLPVYLWDFVWGLIKHRSFNKAYRGSRFEQEAYGNQGNENYLEERKPFAWKKYKV